MTTQYEKLHQILREHLKSSPTISARDIQAKYTARYGDSESTLFPAHFATDPQHPEQKPLVKSAQIAPLLEKVYSPAGKLKRGQYRILIDPQSPLDPNLRQSYDLLKEALAPHVEQLLSMEELTQIVEAHLNKLGIERKSLLENLHRYAQADDHKAQLLLRQERGLYLVLRQSQELQGQNDTTHPRQIQTLLGLYPHHKDNSSTLNRFSSKILTHFFELPFFLPYLLSSESTPNLEPIQQYIRHYSGLSPNEADELLQLVSELAYRPYTIQELLTRLVTPTDPQFVGLWQGVPLFYNQAQQQKSEIEDYFNNPDNQLTQQEPKEVFSKALEWFFGGAKSKANKGLHLELHQRLNRLNTWTSPGLDFWAGLNPSEQLTKTWLQSAFSHLSQVPGLDIHPEDQYPNLYFLSGILATLYPDKVFTVSPPSLAGLQQLTELNLGAFPLSPPATNPTLEWVCDIILAVFSFCQALVTLNPKAKGLITPRSLDKLLYLVRDAKSFKALSSQLEYKTAVTGPYLQLS